MPNKGTARTQIWIIVPAVILILSSAFIVTNRLSFLNPSNNLTDSSVSSTQTYSIPVVITHTVTTGDSSSVSSSSLEQTSTSTQRLSSTEPPPNKVNSTTTASSHSLTTIPVYSAFSVAMNPVTNNIYVTSGSSLVVVSGATNQIISTIALPSGSPTNGNPDEVAVDTDSNMIYVAQSGLNSLAVINGTDNKFATSIPVDQDPYGIAVNSEKHMVYVSDAGSIAVSVVNGTTDKVTDTIQLNNNIFGGLFDVALDSVTSTLYVSASGYIPGSGPIGDLIAINTSTNGVEATIPVGLAPYGIAIDSATDTIYVANSESMTVSAIDGRTNSVQTNITLGDKAVVFRPFGMAIDQDKNLIFVVDSGIDSISTIDTSTNAVVGEFEVGAQPMYAAFDPSTSVLYVTNQQDGTLAVLTGK